jgi:glycerophosphoryl diester phosphodiesterase
MVLVPDISGNLILLAIGLSVTLLMAGSVNLAWSVVTKVLFALFNARAYRLIAGPGRCDPEFAAPAVLENKAAWAVPGKKVIGLAVALLLVMLVGAYFTSKAMGDEDLVEIIAHRGASGAAPENTMAAFQLAIDDQADWIELDVQENADDVVIVAHDNDFMKVAGNPTKVWDATADALRDIDIGS